MREAIGVYSLTHAGMNLSDTNKDNADAAKKFQEVQKAYETLRDPDRRRMYDLSPCFFLAQA